MTECACGADSLALLIKMQRAVRIVAGGTGHLRLKKALGPNESFHLAHKANICSWLGCYKECALLEQVTARFGWAQLIVVEHQTRVTLQMASRADR